MACVRYVSPTFLFTNELCLLRFLCNMYVVHDQSELRFSSCRIFAGYNKTVRIFDIHRPGRDFEQHSTLQGNKEGQSGVCFLFVQYFNY